MFMTSCPTDCACRSNSLIELIKKFLGKDGGTDPLSSFNKHMVPVKVPEDVWEMIVAVWDGLR